MTSQRSGGQRVLDAGGVQGRNTQQRARARVEGVELTLQPRQSQVLGRGVMHGGMGYLDDDLTFRAPHAVWPRLGSTRLRALGTRSRC